MHVRWEKHVAGLTHRIRGAFLAIMVPQELELVQIRWRSATLATYLQ